MQCLRCWRVRVGGLHLARVEGLGWKSMGRSTEREDGDWKGSGAAGERRLHARARTCKRSSCTSLFSLTDSYPVFQAEAHLSPEAKAAAEAKATKAAVVRSR